MPFPYLILLTYKLITRVRRLSLYTYRNCDDRNFYYLLYYL